MSNKEIITIDDIKLLVDSFYEKVKTDELLSEIFNKKVSDWPQHLEKMYSFWQTVLFGEHSYKGSPFVHHATLPLEQKHFERWLLIFYRTIDEHFSGPKAEEAKDRADKMAVMFRTKIDYHKSNPRKLIL